MDAANAEDVKTALFIIIAAVSACHYQTPVKHGKRPLRLSGLPFKKKQNVKQFAFLS